MGKKRVDKGVEGMELLVCRNPKAAKRYEIEERMEAGMVLQGSEVKALRQRRADLEGAYATVDGGELYLHKMHIAPYEQGGPHFNHEPKRKRKLLAKKREIEKLHGRLSTKGYTLVPLQCYFRNGVAKVQLGLGKGKRLGDERESIKRKAELREARDAMRDRKG
jgi:SsrA-binding protein